MHILQVTVLRYPKIVGGVDTMVYTLVEELKSRMRVSVLVPGAWQQKQLFVEQCEGITTYSILLRRPIYDKNRVRNFLAWLIEFPKTLWTLRNIVRDNNIDLIHLHLANSTQFYFLFLKWLTGVPYVLTLHRGDVVDFDELARWEKFTIKWVMRFSSHINAVSQWLADTAKTKFSCIQTVSTVYNGLNLGLIEKDYNYAQTNRFNFPYFIIVGSFDPYKGHLAAIEAWKYVKQSHPEIHLVIAGEGILQAEYESLIAQIGCQNRVHLIGQVPHSEVIQLLKYSKGMIFPSINEGLGYVLLEAGAIHVPVICTNIPTFSDIVEHEGNCLVVPLHDSLALAEAVKRIYDNPKQASEMAKELRNKVYREFSAEKMADHYHDIYRYVLGIN